MISETDILLPYFLRLATRQFVDSDNFYMYPKKILSPQKTTPALIARALLK